MNNRKVGVFLNEIEKEVESPADAAFLIHLQDLLFLPNPEADLSGQVNVFSRDETCIDEAVDGAFTDHETVGVCNSDMMRRLTFKDQRGNDLIKMAKLIFRKREATAGFGEKLPIRVMRAVGMVKMFLQGAFRSAAAAVTNIRRLLKAAAVFRNEVIAEGIAHAAGFAELVVSGSMAGVT